MKSAGSKPPGTASFNIEPAVAEDVYDDVEVLDGLPVGAIFINSEINRAGLTDEWEDVPPWPINEWREHYPYWNQPVMRSTALYSLEPDFCNYPTFRNTFYSN